MAFDYAVYRGFILLVVLLVFGFAGAWALGIKDSRVALYLFSILTMLFYFQGGVGEIELVVAIIVVAILIWHEIRKNSGGDIL